MKTIAKAALAFALTAAMSVPVAAQTVTREVKDRLLNENLRMIDTNIVKYFPRWRVCEKDLQIQVYETFKLLGYNPRALDLNQVVVTAAPLREPNDPYTILLLECGSEKMTTTDIKSNISDDLQSLLSGAVIYSSSGKAKKGDDNFKGTLTYCYQDIPRSEPPTIAQSDAIVNYMQPTNVTHSVMLSVFEQSVKIGESGFWLRNMLGTDQAGYHFWSAGEAKTVLQRPLYINTDDATRTAIPYLINAHLGVGYRVTSGLTNTNSLFSFQQPRRLNAGPGGKFVGGLDFHLPSHPQFGVSVNLELPFQRLENQGIDVGTYTWYQKEDVRKRDDFIDDSSRLVGVAPILRSTGQITAFYNWWPDFDGNPENYFRFDVGMNYTEVAEVALINPQSDYARTEFSTNMYEGLQTYHPREFADWLYAKVEFRNQSNYPFGFSAQYSNQYFLGRVYVPLFGTWLYLEGKYATPLRDARPFDVKNFFMISPVLRVTL